jgi:HSP20 family protein
MRLSWDPFQEFDALQQEAARGFGAGKRAGGTQSAEAFWTPSVDVIEDADGYVFHAELPGVGRDDIELNLENRTLTLRGERKPLEGVKPESYQRHERPVGRFVRAFSLPERVDAAHVDASFRNGVLTVVVPKAEEVRPRRIKVETV